MRVIHILLFYKFQEIENPNYFARKQRRFCNELGVLGKILVAQEGINGSISGTREQIKRYKQYIWGLPGFNDVWFKEETALEYPFTKMHVRIKKEIIRIDRKTDLNKKGKYISPREFLELYENNKDFIVLDARNDYEYKIGRFKNAINPNIKSFREFPKFSDSLKEKIKDKNKKIVMYCTGGIRCEKASSYMIKNGFKNIYQLEGGIMNFCQKYPNTIWEGKCFVFDKRLMTDINQNNKTITRCENCGLISDLYRNCKNVYCDRLVIMCVKCQEKLHGCCSIKCKNVFETYALERAALKKTNKKIV